MKNENPHYDDSMHKGAPPQNYARAKLLRENMTFAEKALWERIRDNRLGVKFRRQHPIHFYIADFYCHQLQLVIEIDGEYHNLEEQQKKDKERSEILQFQDLKIVRFSNQEVLENMEGIIRIIKEKINICSVPPKN